MRTLLAALALALAWGCSHRPAPAAWTGPPNVVFVLTDDLDLGVYQQLSRLPQLMDAEGLAFQRHFLSLSLCCPSRVAILSGRYAHNTQIFNNAPPNGGFETFFANGSEADTLPVWLAAAGYRTVLFGKYLNGYPNTAPADYIPPGWSEWYSPVGGTPYNEYNYTLDENGEEHAYANANADYLVDVMAAKAVDFIHRAGKDRTPFFMYVSTYAPHSPATPPRRYLDDFPGAQAPRTASFAQVDMSAMPTWMEVIPQLTDADLADIDALYRKRLQSMEAVEDLVQKLVDTLDEEHALDHTYIVFTSDNGFHMGQHRMPPGKNTEFDEDLLAPMIVRGPGVAKGATTVVPTVNVDFAPTFLELAGVPVPASVDGRSFAPVLAGGEPAAWRSGVLLEHEDYVRSLDVERSRQGVWSTLEPDDTPAPPHLAPPYVGVRSTRYTYIEYRGGETALFDDVADPAQMTNAIAGADPTMLATFAAMVRALHACSGDACRAAEQAAVP